MILAEQVTNGQDTLVMVGFFAWLILAAWLLFR